LIVGTKKEWRARFEGVQQRLVIRGVKVLSYAAGEDFGYTVAKDGAVWAENLGLSSGGGVVVRPDQHILMHFGADGTSGEITNKIIEHLGL
jgi:hypothetical protein